MAPSEGARHPGTVFPRVPDRDLARNLLLAAGLAAVLAGLQRVPGTVDLFQPARLSINYGFLLLEAYFLGGIFAHFGLPKISGYIVAGILFGPDILGFITQGWAQQMRFIDDLALTFIALTAGSELRLEMLRERGRTIASMCVFGIVLVWGGTAVVMYSLGGVLALPGAGSPAHLAVVAALLGVVAVARSPTSAIAIINECRARGPFTDAVFGTTVVMDTLVILLFAVTVSVGGAVMTAGVGFDAALLGVVAGQLAASVGVGALVGLCLAFYAGKIRKDLGVLLVVLSFLITEGARWTSHLVDLQLGVDFHLEPLLVAMTAGFVVQNFTGQGERLTQALHGISLPIFVVFFSMAGVGLDLDALAATWGAAVVLFLIRAGLIGGSFGLGARVAGENRQFARLSGLAFLTQAGVSLGLAQEISRRFPDWGGEVTTLLVAGITLNQVVGPIAFKFALDRMGESGKADPDP